jgi:hypothetical protein
MFVQLVGANIVYIYIYVEVISRGKFESYDECK